jgi:tRNA dimethylallyltransferase
MTSPTTTKLLVVIDGPTASGKTAIGVRLAKHFSSEVISADSRQFYQEMKIGTARPDLAELQGVPHHFLGFTSVQNELNAGLFERESERIIEQVFEKKDVVFVVGGSGFYIDALLFGIDDIPPILPEIREKMKREYEKRGLAHIQTLLKALDPELYETIDIQNPKRIIRGLEVAYQTGNKLSDYQKGKRKPKWPFLRIGLDWDRALIYERINERVDSMVANGLFEEVEGLKDQSELNALKTVGYTEVFRHLDGEYDRERAIELIKQNTRRYAKRQLTWLRNQSDTKWMDPQDIEAMIKLIEASLNAKQS